MQNSNAMQVGGCYCIVVHTDCTAEVKRFSDHDNKAVFDKAKEFIGCDWLTNVVVQQYFPDAQLVYLVNDNGYAEWGNDPKKVNQIATYIYNGGDKPGHYILGDVVLCWLVDMPDGGEFIGMSEATATRICKGIEENVAPKAKEIVAVPCEVPNPTVKIFAYETIEDIIRHMDGDESVKSQEEIVV